MKENSFKVNEHSLKTAISKVEPNKIVTRGYNQRDLIEKIRYSDMVYLLLKGKLPTLAEGKLFNHILVSFCDHGATPPSTQTARLISSSGSPLNAAVAGALLSFGHKIDIFTDYTSKGEKIPGFGHRYHTVDPRAQKVIELAIEEGMIGNHTKLALAIEDLVHDRKNIRLNIDGANAALLSDLGFTPALGLGVFIIGRIPGLIAHINEENMEEDEFRRFCDIEDIIYEGVGR